MATILDFINAIVAFINAIVAFTNANEGLSVFVAAVIAAIALRQNAATTKAANQPFVSAALEKAPESDAQLLVISNTGRSPAHDVQVTFDPPIPAPIEGEAPRMGPFITKRYAKRIPVLVPGTRLGNVYAGRRDDQQSHYGTPEQTTVTITYRGLGPIKRLKSKYLLDVELLRNETVSLATDSTRGLMKEYRQHLRGIAKSLKTIAAADRQVSEPPDTSDVLTALYSSFGGSGAQPSQSGEASDRSIQLP